MVKNTLLKLLTVKVLLLSLIHISTFSKNGVLYGAGIFIQGSKFSITSCVFDSNTASGKGNMTPNDNKGAAIEVTNTDKAITGTIYKSTFTNNKAQRCV